MSPEITAISFKTESGYTLSVLPETVGTPLDNYIELMMLSDDPNDPGETETFIVHDSWNENNTNQSWQ